MEILIKHISEHLSNFNNSLKVSLFGKIFNGLDSPIKETYKNLLKYLFVLVEFKFEESDNELISLNIHFEKKITDEEKTLIAEFLWHYYFELQHLNETSTEINQSLQNQITALQTEVSRDLILPSNNGHIINRIRENRKRDRKHLSFYKSLKKTATLLPETIINLKVNQERDLCSLFKYNPTYLSVDELNNLNSFVLGNTKGFNDIRQSQINEIPLLRIIKNIILFDCENSVHRFGQFNFQQLSNFNKNHSTNFKFFIVFTFSNKENLNAITTKTNRLKERYYIPQDSSYTITKSEFKLLTDKNINNNVTIKLIEPISSVFWEDFFTETKINGLYELRSIKMMNVYALCYSEDIKNFVLNDVFAKDINPALITIDTKQDILSLTQMDIQSLINLLGNILDVIIQSNLKTTINKALTNETKVLLDVFILKNEMFFNLISQNLNIRGRRKFINWDDLEELANGHILMLSYRDQGNFNYHSYPSINELNLGEDTKIECILPSFLFKQTYDWSQYNLLKGYQKTLDHPIRRSFFDWNALKDKIFQLKPEKSIDISWDLESDYSCSDSRITYRILFSDNSRTTCNPSDLLIYREGGSVQFRIGTIRSVYENIDFYNNSLCIQKLDDLIDDFNPAEKLIDTKQQNKDLEIIKHQFDIGEEDAGRLWKILLARKANNYGVNQLYEKLKTLLKHNNLDIVSKNHFESTWIQPNSESLVPRGNKVFKVICDYLELPITYRRIIYTIKNRTINGKRNATRIYSKLLKDLFNDGCFDEETNPRQVLNNRIDYYKNNHNLDELGIDEDNPLEGLNTLIELIQPELSCNEVSNIEKNEQ